MCEIWFLCVVKYLFRSLIACMAKLSTFVLVSCDGEDGLRSNSEGIFGSTAIRQASLTEMVSSQHPMTVGSEPFGVSYVASLHGE